MSHQQLSTRGGENAQAMVEFALVVGILLLLLFAIVDFSRLIFNYATLSNGVREGARFAVVHPGAANHDAIVAQALERIALIGSTAEVTVEYPGSAGGAEVGEPYCSHLCPVIVTATTDFDAWTPIIPAFQLEAKATMHYE